MNLKAFFPGIHPIVEFIGLICIPKPASSREPWLGIEPQGLGFAFWVHSIGEARIQNPGGRVVVAALCPLTEWGDAGNWETLWSYEPEPLSFWKVFRAASSSFRFSSLKLRMLSNSPCSKSRRIWSSSSSSFILLVSLHAKYSFVAFLLGIIGLTGVR